MKNSKSAQRYKVALESASRNLKKLSDAGVTIAMGTDTGPPARFQGYFELMELELMAKAGLTPRQVLAVGDARRRALHEARPRGRHARDRTSGPTSSCSTPIRSRTSRNTRKIADVYIAGNKVARLRSGWRWMRRES